jgi:tRNA(fMet)-specific endonuclease VapC
MPTYLLDSNALSELMRNPQGPVGREFQRKSLDRKVRMLTSIVVACEMRYGVTKKGSAVLEERVDRMLASLEVAPLTLGAERKYAALRVDLERKGLTIGANDMLIAAHALELDAVLVTDNVREFKRVKGLRLENWLRA